MVALNFDASRVAPAAPLGTVPSGDYPVQITESAMKPTKNGAGQFLELILRIISGEFAGRSLPLRLNLLNSNPQAVEIAYAELSAICHVTGVVQCQDSSQLHNRPFQVRVVEAPRADDATKMGNEIKAILDHLGNPPGEGGAVSASAPTAAPTAAPAPDPAATMAAATAAAVSGQGASAPVAATPAGNPPWAATAPAPATPQPQPAPAPAPAAAPTMPAPVAGPVAAPAPAAAAAPAPAPAPAPMAAPTPAAPAPSGKPPWEQ